uniref:Uncharacterized protein n=1 Tax=viral metagenome TaxID=1070528 RepID=A0A6C0C334_9ZZZZ
MKGLFLFTSGLILGIFIGLNANPNRKSKEGCLNDNQLYGAFYKKKRYHV